MPKRNAAAEYEAADEWHPWSTVGCSVAQCAADILGGPIDDARRLQAWTFITDEAMYPLCEIHGTIACLRITPDMCDLLLTPHRHTS